jgi:energy-converting hydrogenase B subunit D
MIMAENILIIVLSAISLTAAVFAVMTKKTINAIISSGVVSLMASITFLLVAAPDVAMTEAAIGSGLTTVVFLYALKHVRGQRSSRDD